MDLKEEQLLGEQVHSHWYYVAKGEAVLAYLRDVPFGGILDVGAGSGFFSRLLLRSTAAREAICVDPNYAAESDTSEAGKPLRFRRAATAASCELVMMMDVLEHVDDDTGLVRAYADGAAPGTRFLVTVPAFQSLWSGHDVFLEHRRRYSAAQLEQALAGAGLRIERCGYFFGLVLPFAVAQRIVARVVRRARSSEPRSALTRHSPLVNALLLGLCRAELPFMRANRLGGLSAFALAIKP